MEPTFRNRVKNLPQIPAPLLLFVPPEVDHPIADPDRDLIPADGDVKTGSPGRRGTISNSQATSGA